MREGATRLHAELGLIGVFLAEVAREISLPGIAGVATGGGAWKGLALFAGARLRDGLRKVATVGVLGEDVGLEVTLIPEWVSRSQAVGALVCWRRVWKTGFSLSGLKVWSAGNAYGRTS